MLREGELELFDRYADRVHDFVFSLTRDATTAAAITLDVIVMTTNQADRVAGSDEDLRTWLYTQARSEVFAGFSSAGRTPAEDRVLDVPLLPGAYTNADLARIVWASMLAFPERDQALLTLYARQGMDGQRLADVMGISSDAVDMLLPATRERVRTQLITLLLLATGRAAECDSLLEVLEEWDGTFSPFVRRRADELALRCAQLWTDVPGPIDLLRSMPLVPAPASLREAARERMALFSSLGGSSPVAPSIDLVDDTIPPEEAVALPPPSGIVSAHDGPVGEESEDVVISEDVTLPLSCTVTVPQAPADMLVEAGDGPLDPSAGTKPDTAWWVDRQSVLSTFGLPAWISVSLGVALALVVVAGLFRMYASNDLIAAGPTAAGQAAGEEAGVAAQGGATEADAVLDPSVRALRGPADVSVIEPTGESAIRITNTAQRAAPWQLASAPAWIVLDRMSGSIEPGPPIELIASMAPDLPEGDYDGMLQITWGESGEGSLNIPVSGRFERMPEIQDVAVTTNELFVQGCDPDQATFAVVVGDESQLSQVVLSMTGPVADRQMQISLTPDPDQVGRFLGPIGPFDQAGEVATTVTAIDVRTNESRVESGIVTVSACEG